MNEVGKFAVCYSPKDFNSHRSDQCDASRETYEGREAWKDAIVFLSEQANPQPELKRSEALNKACRDHVVDIGPNGAFDHSGSDGSSPADRAQRYISGGSSKVENLAFIDERSGLSAEPESVISQMIINDGELDRDTRKNVLS